jgi:hypothetical protein
VVEIVGTNVATTYISCPAEKKQTLGVKLPFLVMILKNLNRYFSFEVTILDDKGIKRRFRASTFANSTKVQPFITTMPMRLDSAWNQIQFNLSDFTRRAYATNYVETLRVQIHANCRLRRIYFADKLYSEHDLPKEYMLFRHPGRAAPLADGAATMMDAGAAAGGGGAGEADAVDGAGVMDGGEEDIVDEGKEPEEDGGEAMDEGHGEEEAGEA